MTENSLSKIIYVKSRRRLYFGCLIVIFAAALFFSEYNYISNLISGPRSISETALEQELLSGNIKDINVDLKLDPGFVYESGYAHVTQTVNSYSNQVEEEKTDSEYYLTPIGNHILVLEGTPNELPSNDFKGVVVSLPAALQDKLIADLSKVPEAAGLSDTLILPYALSNKGMTSLDYFWTFLFGVGLACGGGFAIFRRAKDMEDKKHYAYQIFSKAGYQSINELSDDFFHDRNSEVIKVGGYNLGKKFLFRNSFFSFDIYPMSQMFWAYKRVIKKSINFIPTGKDYGIVMYFRPNRKLFIKESEKKVDQHLADLVVLCPTARFGYAETK